MLTIAAALIVGCVVFFRVAPLTLFGTDAACYATIAADLVRRPLATWHEPRWQTGSFTEHPPLALWIEAAWFWCFGTTAAAAGWLARVYASLLALVVWLTARRVVDEVAAALSLVGLASLASFQRESQNLMLELPLALACSLALLSCERLPRSRWAIVAFGLTATVAVWIKGVVGLAVIAGLVWAWRRGAPLWRTFAAFALFVLCATATILLFETVRRESGAGPYFATYLRDQVWVAFTQGRHSSEPNPFFHLTTLTNWHLTALLAIPVIAFCWRGQSAEWRSLAQLGIGWMVAVVLPLSLSKQKSDWHLNVVIPGAAWVIGVALRALPLRALRVAPYAVFAWCVAWCVVKVTEEETPRQIAIRSITQTPAALNGQAVSDCSPLRGWVAQHLFAFHWNATWVPCEEPAPWRFDGVRIESRGESQP